MSLLHSSVRVEQACKPHTWENCLSGKPNVLILGHVWKARYLDPVVDNSLSLFQVSDAIASFIWVGLLALTSSKQLISKKDYNPLQVSLRFMYLVSV